MHTLIIRSIPTPSSAVDEMAKSEHQIRNWLIAGMNVTLLSDSRYPWCHVEREHE